MTEFVTLADVKARLRIDHDDDNAMLTGLIVAASGSVINYLKSAAAAYINEDGSAKADVPGVIQTATLMMVGYFYKNPEQNPDSDYERGYLPAPVLALLYPLRDPALA